MATIAARPLLADPLLAAASVLGATHLAPGEDRTAGDPPAAMPRLSPAEAKALRLHRGA